MPSDIAKAGWLMKECKRKKIRIHTILWIKLNL